LSPAHSTKVTHRHYVADAVFVAGVEGDTPTMTLLADALRCPRRPLFLGRRSCPPTRPILLDVRHDVDLHNALADVAWQGHGDSVPSSLLTVLDAANGEDTQPDLPQSFCQNERRYAVRAIRYGAVRLPDPPPKSHDPFLLLSR
jgi:CRISPR system Cascade subunit CasD